MIFDLDMSLAPCLACLLRRMLPTVDRRLLAETFRQLRVLMVPAEARELDLVIAILEDPDQEPTQEFKETLALARAHLARTLEN
jgi:hypothetical protein